MLPPAAGTTDACVIGPDSGGIPERVSVALAGDVDPGHAPLALTDAEQFVFRQVYETLIRVDCTGAVQPGLAASWTGSDSGRRWTFTLRAGARFEDGVPVRAQDVIAAWLAGNEPIGHEAVAASERAISVRLPRGSASVPLFFADPALAVSRVVAGREWPVGTGWYTADTTGGRVTVAPQAGGRHPVLALRAAGSDARDLLDRGVDLVTTDDPAALAYAAGRPDLATVALPWDRTYVLLAPSGALPYMATESQRQSLARDAVRVEARPASGPYWWSDYAACQLEPPLGTSPPAAAAALHTVLFPSDDRTARDLAERLVALGAGGTPGARARGVPASEFTAQLAAATASEYVIALPRMTLEPCRALRDLVARAPWLGTAGAHIVPLLDTRRHVIVRRGAGAFTLDWDGTPRVR